MRGRKKAHKAAGHNPTGQKRATAAAIPDNEREVNWCFKLFDKDFCLRRDDSEPKKSFIDVAARLKPYSRRKWGHIENDRTRDHAINVEQIEGCAQRRLEDLNLGDYTQLWSFHLTAKWRIWGIRDRHIFRVLWWDPDHLIYPVDVQKIGKNRR